MKRFYHHVECTKVSAPAPLLGQSPQTPTAYPPTPNPGYAIAAVRRDSPYKQMSISTIRILRYQWCQDTSDPRHFGPKTLRHWCRSVRKTFRHRCRSVRTLRHWCRNVRKTLRYRSVFGVVCAIVCCDITIASRIGLAWSLSLIHI